nr:hypothetical protein [Tanacetum cinerariifolium]
MYDPNLSSIIGFDIFKFEVGETILVAKKGMFLEFDLQSKYFVRGSCNGLLCLPQKSIPFTTSLAVIHPLRKEFHALPPMQRQLDGPCYLSEVSWGLGFDVFTSIFKMVCVLSRINCSKFPLISMNLCTMVHALGKDDSWREIPQVPPYPTSSDEIFAHVCLYWLISNQLIFPKELICFDVRNEEFTLIYPPKRRCGCCVTDHQLVDLQGEVGYAFFTVIISLKCES